LSLAFHDPAEDDPRSIDTDVDVFPAKPSAAGTPSALAGSIAGDAMADPIE
jgi:hypothetical protein